MSWYRIEMKVKKGNPIKIFGSEFIIIHTADSLGYIDTYLFLYNKNNKLVNNIKEYFLIENNKPSLKESKYYTATAYHYYRTDDLIVEDLNVSNFHALLQACARHPFSGVAVYYYYNPHLHNILRRETEYYHLIEEKSQSENDSSNNYYIISITLFSPVKSDLSRLIGATKTNKLMDIQLKWEITEHNSWSDALEYITTYLRLPKQKLISLTPPRMIKSMIRRVIKPYHFTIRCRSTELYPVVLSSIYHQSIECVQRIFTNDKLLIGMIETGTPFCVTLFHLSEHVQILGESDYTRLSFLKSLICKLRKHYPKTPIVVIDPNGCLASELSQLLPDSYYFHPTKAPFGLNPLENPIDTDTIAEILTDTLANSEEHAKIILKTVLDLVYNELRSPTMKLIYRILDTVKTGNYPKYIDENIREFIRKLEDASERYETTYTSILNQLKKIVDDPIIYRIIKFTTVPFYDIIQNSEIALFSLPAVELGENVASLLSSTILMRIFKMLKNLRKPVIVICNDFQMFKGKRLIKKVLTHGPPRNLYLIISHRNLKQLGDLAEVVTKSTSLKIVFKSNDINIFDNHLSPTSLNIIRSRIERVLPFLSPDQALVYMDYLGPGSSPFLVFVDYSREIIPREEAKKTTTTFMPPEEDQTDKQFKIIFNPIFNLIDLPQPVEQIILFNLAYKKRKITVRELESLIPLNSENIQKTLSNLHEKGYIHYINNQTITLKTDILKDFYKAVPSIHKTLIRAIVLHYFKSGYYITPIKQKLHEHYPEMIAIPYSNPTRLNCKKIIAIKIVPTVNEYKEQVLRTLNDEELKICFTDIHLWTSDVEELYKLVGKRSNVEIHFLGYAGLSFKERVRVIMPPNYLYFKQSNIGEILKAMETRSSRHPSPYTSSLSKLQIKIRKMLTASNLDLTLSPDVFESLAPVQVIEEHVREDTIKELEEQEEIPQKVSEPLEEVHQITQKTTITQEKESQTHSIEIINVKERLIKINDLILRVTTPFKSDEEFVKKIDHAKKIGIQEICMRQTPRYGENVYILLNDSSDIVCKFIKKCDHNQEHSS